jgi:hypothetical protein
MLRRTLPLLLVLATLGTATSVSAQALEAPMGISAVGLGSRIRFEPGRLSIDVYGDRLMLDAGDGLRRQVPLGFTIGLPLGLTNRLSVRPQLGISALYSSFNALDSLDNRTEDLLIGLHGGAGLELALNHRISAFWDYSAVGYLSLVHNAGGLLGDYEQEKRRFGALQSAVGVRAALGS